MGMVKVESCPLPIDMFLPLKEDSNYKLLSEEETQEMLEVFKENTLVAFEIEAECESYDDDCCEDCDEDCDDCYDSSYHIQNQIADEVGFENAEDSDYTIYDVKGDGSLNNGIELTIYGQPTNSSTVQRTHEIVKKATKSMLNHGLTIKRSCGGHMHIMLRHNGNVHMFGDDGMVIPKIIMANFYQLIRRFAPELTWLTSTMKNDNITRSFGYRGYQRLLQNSPRKHTPSSLNRNQGGRYSYFNLNRAHFNSEGDVTVFHVELRFPDGNLSANALTAYANLFSSLMLESVKYSQYGLLSTGSKDSWARAKELMQLFEQGNRDSFTTESIRSEMVKRCGKLFRIVKDNLKAIDGDRTLEILKALAEKPIAFMLEDSCGSWETVDAYLHDRAIELSVQKIIDKCEVTDQPTEDSWIDVVSSTLKVQSNIVRNIVANSQRKFSLQFSAELGTYVAS